MAKLIKSNLKIMTIYSHTNSVLGFETIPITRQYIYMYNFEKYTQKRKNLITDQILMFAVILA